MLYTVVQIILPPFLHQLGPNFHDLKDYMELLKIQNQILKKEKVNDEFDLKFFLVFTYE